MSREICYIQHPYFVDWLCKVIGLLTPMNMTDSKTISLVNGAEVLAVVLYNHYTGTDICMHVAAQPGCRWMTRAYLKAAFAYPFEQLQTRRITGLVTVSNEKALLFDKHLGFVEEGRLRKAGQNGEDMFILGLLREDCRFL